MQMGFTPAFLQTASRGRLWPIRPNCRGMLTFFPAVGLFRRLPALRGRAAVDWTFNRQTLAG